MSTVSPSDLPPLLRALDAIRNGRAYLALLLGALLASAWAGASGFFAVRLALWGWTTMSAVVSLAGGLGALVLFLAAFSAAGTSLLDQARGLPARPFGSLWYSGFAALGRLLLLSLLLLLIYAGIWIVALVLLFITKLPGLGPLIYFVVFPVSVLVFGGFGFVVLFVVNPLAAPAIWDGSGVLQAVAKLAAVARTSLLKVVLSQSLLFLLLLFTGLILFGALFGGIGITSTLSAMVLGSEGRAASLGLGALENPAYALSALSNSMRGGYAIAGGIGSAVLFAAAWMAVVLIAISGNCLIYLTYAAELDASEVEGALREGAKQIKAKAEAAREQARAQAAAAQQAWQERQRQSAAADEARCAAATASADTAHCPQCQAPVQPDDTFCGSCGHRQPGRD